MANFVSSISHYAHPLVFIKEDKLFSIKEDKLFSNSCLHISCSLSYCPCESYSVPTPVTVMAFSIFPNNTLLIVTLASIAILSCYSGAAEDDLQGQSLQKALSCFDNKLIYVGCAQPYRLNPSGNINVPPEAIGPFCNGPCLTETQLVLHCIDNVISNFLFDNKANVNQIRYALVAGCNYAEQRGSFNLGEYIGGQINSASKFPHSIGFYVFVLLLVVAAVNLM